MSDLVIRAAALREKIDQASAPVDSGEANRVLGALNTLEQMRADITALHENYVALESDDDKQAVIVEKFDEIMIGVQVVLDILAGTIRASVRGESEGE